MRLLDLFCGAGGAALGYAEAGFTVTGVDIDPQPFYPFDIIQTDVLVLSTDFLRSFDVVHASPPCQAHTPMSNRWRKAGSAVALSHVDLIPPTRHLLHLAGVPYVIENVVGARSHLVDPLLLRGSMFGLEVDRPRLFECSFTPPEPPPVPKPRPRARVGIYGEPNGRRLQTRTDGTELRAWTFEDRHLIGMGHVTDPAAWHDVAEAIPPAYTRFIGEYLLR